MSTVIDKAVLARKYAEKHINELCADLVALEEDSRELTHFSKLVTMLEFSGKRAQAFAMDMVKNIAVAQVSKLEPKKPKKPIVVEPEDIKELKKWGMNLEKIIEHCVFCSTPTRFWHRETNNPVCQDCASKHSVGELTNHRKPKK